MRITGTFTALVTPFTADGEAVDHPALEALVEAQIAGGVSGLVPVGTTGEAPTLGDDEQVAVIKRVVDAAKKRVPVLAGTGSFSTKKTIAASKAALAAGADAVMVVMPYYNKPSQAGMVEHVVAVAKAVGGAPVVAYNVPGRTVADLGVEAIEQICERAPNVVAIKDASGNVLRCQEMKRRLGDRLTVMCGDDALTVGMMACGASGLISVTSNVRPREVSEVVKLMATGEVAKARELHLKLLELHGLMFAEPSPAPAKAVLAAQGRMQASVRLPILPAGEATRTALAAALKKLETK